MLASGKPVTARIGVAAAGSTYSRSSVTTTKAAAGPEPKDAQSDLVYPAVRPGQDEYIRQVARREASARAMRPPARLICRASAMSSRISVRTAACPPDL